MEQHNDSKHLQCLKFGAAPTEEAVHRPWNVNYCHRSLCSVWAWAFLSHCRLSQQRLGARGGWMGKREAAPFFFFFSFLSLDAFTHNEWAQFWEMCPMKSGGNPQIQQSSWGDLSLTNDFPPCGEQSPADQPVHLIKPTEDVILSNTICVCFWLMLQISVMGCLCEIYWIIPR